MYKTIIVICTLSLSSWQCKTQPNLTDKRKSVIRQAMSAISIYDTTKLYKIVDTAYYFDIDGKEGFLFTVDYLNKKFKECGSTFVDSVIEIREGTVNAKEYILPFCRNKDNSLSDNSFDLIFKFADYQNVDKIMFIDTKNYLDPSKIKPTIPAPEQ